MEGMPTIDAMKNMVATEQPFLACGPRRRGKKFCRM